MMVTDRFGNVIETGDTVVIISRHPFPIYEFAGRRGVVVEVDGNPYARFPVRVQIDSFSDVPLESYRLHKLPYGYEAS